MSTVGKNDLSEESKRYNKPKFFIISLNILAVIISILYWLTLLLILRDKEKSLKKAFGMYATLSSGL